MAKATFLGHPLHPELIALPAALLPFSAVLDTMHSVTGNESYAEAAYYSMVGGYAGGLAATAAGAADYFEIPSGTHTKRIANVHAALNIGLLGLYSINLMMRRSNRGPGRVAKLLSLVGTGGLLVSAWYGGHLVFNHGVRVKGVDPIGDAPDARLPGDRQLSHALEEAGKKLAPAAGPSMRDDAESDSGGGRDEPGT